MTEQVTKIERGFSRLDFRTRLPESHHAWFDEQCSRVGETNGAFAYWKGSGRLTLNAIAPRSYRILHCDFPKGKTISEIRTRLPE